MRTVGRIKPADMLLGNEQYMRWRGGMQVFKGEDAGIFPDFAGGDLSGRDFAEYAVHRKLRGGLPECFSSRRGRALLLKRCFQVLPGQGERAIGIVVGLQRPLIFVDSAVALAG